MFQDDECVDALMGLGLTFLQAKTYLGLARVGCGDVKAISDVSNVARRDVCRVVPKLEKLGLAEKIVSSQSLYKAVPLKKGLVVLLQQKVEENAAVEEKAHRLIEGFDEGFGGVTFQDAPVEFVITSERTLFHEKVSESTNAAQKSVDSIVILDGFNVMFSYGKRDIESALARGVKVRVLTEEPENPQETRDMLRGFENPLLTVKYVPAPVPICMMIFDDEEVHLRMCEGAVPSFWSNNPHIVNLSRKYFDEMWNKLP